MTDGVLNGHQELGAPLLHTPQRLPPALRLLLLLLLPLLLLLLPLLLLLLLLLLLPLLKQKLLQLSLH